MNLDLTKLSDEELRELAFSITDEQHSRVVAQIEAGVWSEPDWDLTNGVDDIVKYRDEMRGKGHDISLITAKYIVDYYRQKEYLESINV